MHSLIRIACLLGYQETVRSLGSDPQPLLVRHGLSAQQIDAAESLVELERIMHLLEDSAAATRCPDFALQLAQRQDLRILGPLAVILQNAATVAEALHDCSRYMFVHSPGLAFNVHRSSPFGERYCELVIEITGAESAAFPQSIELCLGDMHMLMSHVAGSSYRPRAVYMPHTPLLKPTRYASYFGAPVYSGQAYAALHVDAAFLDQRLANVNAAARQMAMAYFAREFGSSQRSVGERVRHCLVRALGTPYSQREDVARLLSLHPRTLQRRLADEGQTFDAIKDEVRREAALRYLSATQVQLSQLADVLWLSNQSALTRACQRWFGKSPKRLRQEKQT